MNKNFEGKLLVFRRLIRNKLAKKQTNHTFSPGYLYIIPTIQNCKPITYLTYGEPCLLLSYEKLVDNKVKLTILLESTNYYCVLSNNQVNKWFTLYDLWVDSKHQTYYDEFVNSKVIHDLWKILGIERKLTA